MKYKILLLAGLTVIFFETEELIHDKEPDYHTHSEFEKNKVNDLNEFSNDATGSFQYTSVTLGG